MKLKSDSLPSFQPTIFGSGLERPKAKKPPQEVGINLPKDNVKQKSAA